MVLKKAFSSRYPADPAERLVDGHEVLEARHFGAGGPGPDPGQGRPHHLLLGRAAQDRLRPRLRGKEGAGYSSRSIARPCFPLKFPLGVNQNPYITSLSLLLLIRAKMFSPRKHAPNVIITEN